MTSQTSTKNSKRASLVKVARESLSDKVLLKIEENEFLNYLHEQGIKVEQLTEEELDELFGFNTRTSRDAVASSQSPKVRARRKKEQKDRIAKFTADRKAAKPKPAEKVPTSKPAAASKPRRKQRFNPATGKGGDNMAEPSEHANKLKDKQDTAKHRAISKVYRPGGSTVKSARLALAEGRMDLAERVLSELSIGALKRYQNKALAQDQAGGGSARRSTYIGRAEDKIRQASNPGSSAQKAATGEHGNVGRSRTGTQTSLTAFGGKAGNSEDQKAANKNRKIPAGRITPEREKKLGDAADKFMGKPTEVDVNAPNASLDAEQAGKGRQSRRVARSNRDPEFAKTLRGKP